MYMNGRGHVTQRGIINLIRLKKIFEDLFDLFTYCKEFIMGRAFNYHKIVDPFTIFEL